MMLKGLELLANDSQTSVIVLLSKPPAEQVTHKILSAAANIEKPVVVIFMGVVDDHTAPCENIHIVSSLAAGAIQAARLAGRDPGRIPGPYLLRRESDRLKNMHASLAPSQWTAARALLALNVNGVPLAPDHGYPARMIAPDLPGVHCTKWVGRMEFSA